MAIGLRDRVHGPLGKDDMPIHTLVATYKIIHDMNQERGTRLNLAGE